MVKKKSTFLYLKKTKTKKISVAFIIKFPPALLNFRLISKLSTDPLVSVLC